MLRPGQVIALCVIALLCLGVVMVNSADMSLDARRVVTLGSVVMGRSTAYMVLALAAMGAVALLPVRSIAGAFARADCGGAGPRWWRALTGPLTLWVATALLLGVLATVYLPVVGKSINGSHRWLEFKAPALGKLSFQPSELAKWAMVLVVAWYCATRGDLLKRFWAGLAPILLAVAAVAGFIVLEDLGTGVLVGAVACVVMVAAGARVWQMALVAPAALAGLAMAVVSSEYRLKRLASFLDPYADPERTGYHMIQSMVAVANGGGAGRGLGHGLQKFGYLPEDRTDFLFAVICEELGIAGAVTVVGLYLVLLAAGYSVLRRESTPMLKLAALGVLTTLGLQAVINIAVVTGLGPTKGIALPLVSSGGTGWILTAASLGLLVAMDRGHAALEVSQSTAARPPVQGGADDAGAEPCPRPR